MNSKPKYLGKGLFYISDLEEAIPFTEINSMDNQQFNMLLSFCNESEIGRLYNKLDGWFNLLSLC